MANERPNIILIITDQQRFDTIRALGFPYVDTPNLDRLVNEGVTFTNALSPPPRARPRGPACSPAITRTPPASLKNADLWRHSWVESLAESGYYCVNVGKMHTFPFETPLGFHERYVVENKDRYLEGATTLTSGTRACGRAGWSSSSASCYRQRPDYRERLGAFEWELPEDAHPDFFVGDMATWWVQHQTQARGAALSSRSAFPARTRPTTPSRATPSPTWSASCRCPPLPRRSWPASRRPSRPCACTTRRSITTRSPTR